MCFAALILFTVFLDLTCFYLLRQIVTGKLSMNMMLYLFVEVCVCFLLEYTLYKMISFVVYI